MIYRNLKIAFISAHCQSFFDFFRLIFGSSGEEACGSSGEVVQGLLLLQIYYNIFGRFSIALSCREFA